MTNLGDRPVMLADSADPPHAAWLPAGHRAENDERLPACDDSIGQWFVGRSVGEVFLATVEPEVRSTLATVAVTHCAEQHRVSRLKAVQEQALCHRAGHLNAYLSADVSKVLQMRRQDNPDHVNTWTSTESTAGRSRTIGAQLSPSAEW